MPGESWTTFHQRHASESFRRERSGDIFAVDESRPRGVASVLGCLTHLIPRRSRRNKMRRQGSDDQYLNCHNDLVGDLGLNLGVSLRWWGTRRREPANCERSCDATNSLPLRKILLVRGGTTLALYNHFPNQSIMLHLESSHQDWWTSTVVHHTGAWFRKSNSLWMVELYHYPTFLTTAYRNFQNL